MKNNNEKVTNNAVENSQPVNNNSEQQSVEKVSEEQKKTPKKSREKAIDNQCPGCGAPIKFDPSVGKWKCEYCNSEFTLEDMQKHNNASSEEVNKEDDVTEEDIEYTSYRCENCGAEIVADSQTSATFCVYCGNTAILKSKLAGKFAPDLLIPFKTTKEQAVQNFIGLKKGRPFIPKDFLNGENVEKIRGIYIPFWLNDILVSGTVNFTGEIVTRWSRGDTTYTKTDKYKLYRSGSMNFEKVPVDGSTRFANDIMNSIEPFNYKELVKYNHAYLSGFYAEMYDVSNEESFKEAGARTLRSGQEIFLNSAPGYSAKIPFENNLTSKQTGKAYALLPVWMVNVKYKDKTYLFAMNGQTGKFIGNIPLDKGKVVLWSIGIFAIILLVITLFIFGGLS